MRSPSTLTLLTLALALATSRCEAPPDEPPATRLVCAEPVIAVVDLEVSLAYWRDQLGFTNEWRWDHDPTCYGGISRDGVHVMFQRNPELAGRSFDQTHYIVVEGIVGLYRDHIDRAAHITRPLREQSWGMREYAVTDPTGVDLIFGEPIPCDEQGCARRAAQEGRARALARGRATAHP